MTDAPASTVFILIATERISGPLKGIFQYLGHLDQTRYRPLLGLLRARRLEPSDAELEAQRLGIPYVVLEQSGSFDWSLVRRARRLALEHHAVLVQTHGYKTHLIGFLLKGLTSLPWIGFEHGWTAENWRIRAYHRLDWLLRYADRVVPVSGALHGQLRRMGVASDRLVRIHNAVETEEGWSDVPPGQFRRAQGIPLDKPLMSVIGRISREKGQLVFLDAFAQLKTAVPQACAAIVGEGVDGDAVRQRATELGVTSSVRVVGWQRPVTPVYVDTDVVVIPSLSEGISNVLLEAMAAGRPIVATSVGGTPEVVTTEQHALLVPSGDAGAMAQAVTRLLEDKALRDRLVEEARHRITIEYSPSQRTSRIAQVYDTLVAR